MDIKNIISNRLEQLKYEYNTCSDKHVIHKRLIELKSLVVKIKNNELIKVYNKYHLPKDYTNNPYYIYAGRGSKFGNPFAIGAGGNRDDVIDKYRHYFMEQIESNNFSKKDLYNLIGHGLVCFCKPKPCHCDIIKEHIEYNFLDLIENA